MANRTIKIKLLRPAVSYRITIGAGLLDNAGVWALSSLKRASGKIVIVSDTTVFGPYGRRVETALSSVGFTVSHFLIRPGERSKTMRNTERALAAFAAAGLGRTDAVVALGGGVVGDLAGFAAGIYLRGIRYMQIPTTLLAMVDSSVGGKTGVNTDFGKNLVGAFHDPAGVLIDPEVLSTLPQRELTAGSCEVIKHSVLAGRDQFKRTNEFLAKYELEGSSGHFEDKNFRSEISNLIAANVEFKSKIVSGDSLEETGRTDSRSRKILNLGHTLAHALEKVTDYKHLRHGEAVGYGLLFAAELSKSLALLGQDDVNLLYDVVHRVGPLPTLAGIDPRDVVKAFDLDKKNIAGSRQFVLLRGIGKPVIVSGRDIPPKTLLSVLTKCLRKWA